MTNSLLDKARAILANPKQGFPERRNLEVKKNKACRTDPTVPVFTPGDNTLSHTGSIINTIEIQPAEVNAKAAYWETGDGRILGPAVPEFFLRDGEEYWISVTFEGNIRFIRDDLLRSRKAFEQQPMVHAIELIPRNGF
ncbi:MAG: hypothetical protein NDI90_09920 [Nitrospira sp. BO4]|jgi:hypothetical protein|nr:hypothetical protein [Nitrospira sp. BO4]